jgi:hypothetical protein
MTMAIRSGEVMLAASPTGSPAAGGTGRDVVAVIDVRGKVVAIGVRGKKEL